MNFHADENIFVQLNPFCDEYIRRNRTGISHSGNLAMEYFCLHRSENQSIQSMVELNNANKMMHSFLDIKTVFLKNLPIADEWVKLEGYNYSLNIEIYRKFQSSASDYFDLHKGSCHESSTVQIAYYLYGYVYDQLASLKFSGSCLLDSHPGNIFVLNDNFYWGEYGSELEVLRNSSEANRSLQNSVNSTIRMFDYYMEDCKISNDTIWFVGNVSTAIKKLIKLPLLEFFEGIEEVISGEVLLFPRNIQEQFYAKVGPQVHSKILSLYSNVAQLTQQNAQQDVKISELKQQNGQQDVTISELKQQNSQQDVTISELKQQNARSSNETAALKDRLAIIEAAILKLAISKNEL